MSASRVTDLAITNPLVKYRALVATKAIKADPGQHRLAIYLAKLYERLKDYEPEVHYRQRLDQISRTLQGQRQDGGLLSAGSTWRRFLDAGESRETLALTRRLTARESAMQMQSPKGLMLHGEVGTGKSMLIDLFADCLPNRKKRRWHFNTFMLETFARLEGLRQSRSGESTARGSMSADDDYSLLWLAREMIHTSPIIFLDEFQMPDRVASKILTNLMTSFFHLGGVLVATSNRMPEELAKAAGIAFSPPPSLTPGFGWGFGARRRDATRLNASYNEFAAFLEVLKARCEVMEMEGGQDYRRLESGTVARQRDDLEQADSELWRLDGHEDLQHSMGMPGWSSNDLAASKIEGRNVVPDQAGDVASTGDTLPRHYSVSRDADELRKAIIEATNGIDPEDPAWAPAVLSVYGRKVSVPRAYGGYTIWRFDELCKATFGPADYITLASTYHTLILTDVPVMNWLMKNEARRLITLLDALYECRCKLYVSAADGPDDIFFPEQQKQGSGQGDSGDSVYSETLSEVYQDATAPFRPNILTQNPNYAEPESEPDYTHARLVGLLRADALEDDPPNKPKNPFGRSFGRTDSEMERKPVDPDDIRHSASRPDFSKTSAFTGEDERFAYRRAQSRLWEMCSARWWAREEVDWHRPLPQEVRRWEGAGLRRAADGAGTDQSPKSTDVHMGSSIVDQTRDERSFKRVERQSDAAESTYSPFRTATEPPPKFSWVHFFGTMKWGPKAGAWGQGVDGLKDRKKEP